MTRKLDRPSDMAVLAGSAEATEVLGARLGAQLRAGDVISLDGPLGAGKTVFVRGLARGRGLDPLQVRSPTFVLHHVYGAPARLHHLDLYRLGGGAAIAFLDLDSLIEAAPAAVEWGGNADLGPWHPLRLTIDITGDQSRTISVVDTDSAPDALLTAWRATIEDP